MSATLKSRSASLANADCGQDSASAVAVHASASSTIAAAAPGRVTICSARHSSVEHPDHEAVGAVLLACVHCTPYMWFVVSCADAGRRHAAADTSVALHTAQFGIVEMFATL
jgi:hypothetical protein